MAVTVPAVALKLAVVAAAATVTEAGTVRAELLEDRDTDEPPDGAALESVTVQADAAPAERLEGEHESAVTVGVTGLPPVDPTGVFMSVRTSAAAIARL